MNTTTTIASRTAAAAAGLGLVLALSLAGAGAAEATTPVTAACTTAKQQVTYSQSSLDEATATRNGLGNQVTAQKADRQKAINAGNVEKVGQINVQLGSSTAMYNTMDSSVATAQAQLVRSKAAKSASC